LPKEFYVITAPLPCVHLWSAFKRFLMCFFLKPNFLLDNVSEGSRQFFYLCSLNLKCFLPFHRNRKSNFKVEKVLI
jgi:hypothetical protein